MSLNFPPLPRTAYNFLPFLLRCVVRLAMIELLVCDGRRSRWRSLADALTRHVASPSPRIVASGDAINNRWSVLIGEIRKADAGFAHSQAVHEWAGPR